MSKRIVKQSIEAALHRTGHDYVMEGYASVVDDVARGMGESLEMAVRAAIAEAAHNGFDPHDAASVLVDVGLAEPGFAFEQARALRPTAPSVQPRPVSAPAPWWRRFLGA